MSKVKYNGWTNQSTWRIALRCDYLRDVLFIKEYLENLDIEDAMNGLINEVVSDFYIDVNWNELENSDWLEDEE